MAHLLVVHCKRAPHEAYVGRPTRWGDPFVVGRDGSRTQVIALYEGWLVTQPALLAALAGMVRPEALPR